MSEEVLKALMQLFAIIGNQDSGSGNIHVEYVQNFLKSQISDDRIPEFVESYSSFIKTKEAGDEGAKRTLMKDSVRTLAICKRINKTLNQKQKRVVFFRLLEFTLQEKENAALRNEIIRTVAEVFNISKEEYEQIYQLLGGEETPSGPDFLVMSSSPMDGHTGRQLIITGFPGCCIFLLDREVNILFFIYRGDAELYLNGLVVKPGQINVLSPGSAIRHNRGTVFYSDVISHFLNETFENTVQLHAVIGTHRHPNGKTALHPLTISENSGTLFGIMGASGSGKTTLLNVLSGNDRPGEGSVCINGYDIHKEPEKISGVIGFIPQDDLLIEELTVYQNLFLSAQLCFRHISEKELHLKVSRLLQALGLFESREVRVGNPLNKKISGGQRKRLNIALELVREPQVLFVDEPTSGLSSKDSENVMDLLKELSHKGKLIFVVIHQPSSDIFKMFDKLLLLDTGGYPVYYGNPVESVIYFKQQTRQINSHIAECNSCGSVNPELIFNLVEAREIDEYGNYTAKRKMTPEGWNVLYRKKAAALPPPENSTRHTLKVHEIPGKLKQWWIYLKRDFLSKTANAQYLLINLLEVPALAFILAVLIRFVNRPDGYAVYSYYRNENIPAFFFMAIVVALLVGLTVSAEEIFKDQKILKREKFLHLSRLSYLFSKVLILFVISAVQSLMLCLIGYFVLHIPGNLPAFLFIIFSVFCSANLLGLVLSSTFNSPVTIYIIIPLVIIPQMLLGGAMFKYSKLNDLLGGSNNHVPPVSNLMVSRWAYEGIVVDLFKTNPYEKEVFLIDKLESKLNYRVSYLIPKLEELIEIRTKQDSVLPVKQKIFLDALISKTIRNEYVYLADRLGFKPHPLDRDSLLAMKTYLNINYVTVLRKKEEKTTELLKKGITEEYFTNKNMVELVTNATEKKKILVDTANLQFVQIMDPVYNDPAKTGITGLDSHFYAPYKYLFGKEISTYTYNLLMIWLLNAFSFLLLYFDIFKHLIHLSGNITAKMRGQFRFNKNNNT